MHVLGEDRSDWYQAWSSTGFRRIVFAFEFKRKTCYWGTDYVNNSPLGSAFFVRDPYPKMGTLTGLPGIDDEINGTSRHVDS